MQNKQNKAMEMRLENELSSYRAARALDGKREKDLEKVCTLLHLILIVGFISNV